MKNDEKNANFTQIMSKTPTYNEEQRLAIKTRDKDILVAAGAGCGKTFVMIERIADNIIQKVASVDQLLVVTYTNAAASEMRVKLANKINDLLADPQYSEEDKNYLRVQADLIGQSDICTLHKFCQNIIQKYFYVLDLDSSFAICDDGEANVLRNRAMREIFDELIAKNDSDFALLSNTFDDKRGLGKISDYVLKIYEFLNNQPDIEVFRAKVNSAFDADLNKNKFAKVLNKNTAEFCEHYYQVFDEFRLEAIRVALPKMSVLLTEYVVLLGKIKKTNTFEQNLHLAFNLKFSALPGTKAKSVEEEDLRRRVSAVKKKFSDGLTKILEDYITDDVELIKSDILSSQKIVNAMLDLVQKFRERYLQLKKDKNLLDFSDLEHFAYQILSNPQVNEEVRSRYRQIYVDEYQDVNDIQEGILNRVHDIRDIFLVGDVKQSIYGFRNTNPQIFLDKLEKFGAEDKDFGNSITINLNNNYRSDQRVLDYVNWVFGILMTKEFAGIDYNNGNAMNSASGYQHNNPKALPTVEFMIVNKTKETAEKLDASRVYQVSTAPLVEDVEKSYAKAEAYAIYNKIMYLLGTQKTIYDAKKKIDREIQFNDITILARTRSDALVEILNTLTELGLPVAPLSKESVLKEYEVRLLFDYLNLVNNRTDDIFITEFLVSPVISLDEEDLCKIRQSNPSAEYFYQCVLGYDFDDEIGQKIKFALDLIEKSRYALINGTIYQVLMDFCQETNYLNIVGAMQDGEGRVRNVMGFVNSFIDKKFNFDLRDYLANMEENMDKPDISREPNTEASVIGVATMHESKGLEYPIVFMVDCGHQYNIDDKKGDFLLSSELGIGMYAYDSKNRIKRKTILHSAVKLAGKDKDLAERQRLLYVAMTRAKNHLFISGAIKIDTFQPYQSAYMLKSTQNDLSLILSSLSTDAVESLKSVKSFTQKVAGNDVTYTLVDVPQTEESAENVTFPTYFESIPAKYCNIVAKNMNFSYPYQSSTKVALNNSVTMLNRFAFDMGESVCDEPKKFDLTEDKAHEHVDTEVGIAFHKAMQLIDFGLDSEPEIREFLGKKLTEDELNLIDCGKILQAVRNLRPIVCGAKLLREQEFMMQIPLNELIKTDVADEILVQGIIDLIILKDDQIILLDYKTSNTRDLEKTAQKYSTQLRCYQKAVENVYKKPVKSKFLYFFLQERLILIDNY